MENPRATKEQGACSRNPVLNIRHGAYLPHWTMEGSTYFVTFRLGDSLSQSVLANWTAEREAILKHWPETQGLLTPEAAEQVRRLFTEQVDAYLDAGRGACWLKDPRVAKLVQDALLYFDGERYTLTVWNIMPNHVHVVVRPQAKQVLPVILHSWKSFTSKESNKALRRRGSLWRPEYYDHLVRDEEDFWRCVDYTYHNSDRAGLTNWPWRGIRTTGVSPVSGIVPRASRP